MKIYHKKGMLLGALWTVLASWSLLAAFRSPESNPAVQVRDILLSLFLLALGVTSFVRAFSKSAAHADCIEALDERNRLVEMRSKARTLDIAYGILFILMLCGLTGFQLSASMVWFAIFVIPGFLLGVFLLIEIAVKLYYERRE